MCKSHLMLHMPVASFPTLVLLLKARPLTPFYTLFTICTIYTYICNVFDFFMKLRNEQTSFTETVMTLCSTGRGDIKRWLSPCCLYVLGSRSCLLSLMPCSAATATMWSRAFMWLSIFTTSFNSSLVVRRSTSDIPRLLRCSVLARWAR